jgi:heme-degrading monooxygenase HmoA
VFARVARYEVAPERIDDAVQAFGQAAREIEQLDGFEGGYLLVDPDDGRTMTLTVWTNFAAVEASEKRAREARQQAAHAVDGEVLSVELFEIAQELVPAQRT